MECELNFGPPAFSSLLLLSFGVFLCLQAIEFLFSRKRIDLRTFNLKRSNLEDNSSHLVNA